MNRDELIETIQRLLALSSSSNEHESALALARANDLMAKHAISMVDVETQKASAEYCTEDVYSGGRAAATDPFICDVLQKYFFVKAVNNRNLSARKTTLRFFGDKANVEIARYVYHFLDRQYRFLADFNQIRARDRRTYYAGLSEGLKDKLKKEREQLNQGTGNRNALIVVDKALVEAFNNHFKNLKSGKMAALSQNMDAYNLGATNGRDINLRKGIAENKDKAKLIGNS